MEMVTEVSNKDLSNQTIYTEDECFNSFLELFEDEEMNSVICKLCGKEFEIRASIDADIFICADCNDRILHNYIKGLDKI